VRRRSFLKGTGIVTVAVVAGGVWRAWDQGVFSVGEGPAYEPWKDWRSTGNDVPLALVRAAILAASPHNTQPWLFKITDSSIELHIDTQRNVGALDPYLREEHIGMGCALENLMLAAPANGYAAAAALLPGMFGIELAVSIMDGADLSEHRRKELALALLMAETIGVILYTGESEVDVRIDAAKDMVREFNHVYEETREL
jgi:hypothetical protein